MPHILYIYEVLWSRRMGCKICFLLKKKKTVSKREFLNYSEKIGQVITMYIS